jgi:hypothetical protein
MQLVSDEKWWNDKDLFPLADGCVVGPTKRMAVATVADVRLRRVGVDAASRLSSAPADGPRTQD